MTVPLRNGLDPQAIFLLTHDALNNIKPLIPPHTTHNHNFETISYS